MSQKAMSEWHGAVGGAASISVTGAGGRHRDSRSNPKPAGILANLAATRAKPSVEPAIPPAGGIARRQVVRFVLEGGDDNQHRAEGT
jgi:hypothetical protein